MAVSALSADAAEWTKESDPDPQHVRILIEALQRIQAHGEEFLREQHIPEEGRSVYYKSIDFLGRVITVDGPRHFFLLTRVVSGPIPDRADVPLAHSAPILAWFDESMKLMGTRIDVDYSAELISGNHIRISRDYRTFDLLKQRDYRKVTGSTELVAKEDVIGEIENAEQGVAPQSATRPESKSEGGEPPQPESKPRPR
jgi:hypothetical protein